MGNIPGNPVHYALENQVDDVFYISNSHLCDRMWVEFKEAHNSFRTGL